MESVQTPAEPTLEAMKAAYDQSGSLLLNFFLAREEMNQKIQGQLSTFFKAMNEFRKATEPAPAQSTSPTPAA